MNASAYGDLAVSLRTDRPHHHRGIFMPHRVDEGLAGTLKWVAATLKAADIPFALGGSFAVYAHGGHSSDHDVDFLIRERDKEQALAELAKAGFRVEQPPED